MEKGDVHYRAGTTSAFFGRELARTWAKTGFVRILIVGGAKRDSRAPDVSTIWDLMEKEKTPEPARRVATVILSPGFFGRPILSTPGIPPDRVKVLRDAFMKTMNDPELLAEAKKRDLGVGPTSGDELEATAKALMVQPPEVIEQMKKLLAK